MRDTKAADKPLLLPATLRPAAVTLLLMVLYLFLVLYRSGGDARVLARIGTRYSQGEAQGTEGYDGQFVYYIARDPSPSRVARYLDVPAYRYQRILLPLAARLLAGGDPELILWALPILNLTAHMIGTWVIAILLAGWGISPWYALIYGLWVGFVLALRLDLPEPLAYALVAGALLSNTLRRDWLAWLLFGLALFAKEVTILFVASALLSYLFQRRWRQALGITTIALLPFAAFQVWLWLVFGGFGLSSGGSMATSFELIPFMGFLRIFVHSLVYGLAMLVVFGPAVLFPTVWGLVASVKKLLSRDANVVVLALLLNTLAIVFLPFSTFRETGGLLRFSCGFVMAILCFTALFNINRALRLGLWWLVLNVFILKS